MTANARIGEHPSPDPLGPSFFILKTVFGEFVVLRACLSCSCRLLSAPFLLLSVPSGWQGCYCPDLRGSNHQGSLTKLASWREVKQSKRRGHCRSERFGRHVLCSKAPKRQTKSLKRNGQRKKIFLCSHDSTCHKVRSSRPNAGKFLALNLDDLTLRDAELRSSRKTSLLSFWRVIGNVCPVTGNFGSVTNIFGEKLPAICGV